MMTKPFIAASGAALALAFAVPASATILLGTQSGSAGGSFTIANPTGLTIPNVPSPNVFGLNEQQDQAATGTIQVNLGSSILAGDVVSSHFIYFNPIGPGRTSATGTITFRGKIVGIQTSTPRIANLSAPYAAYQATGTTYNYGSIANLGLELGNNPPDLVTYSGGTLTYTFNANAAGFDSIRVFTAVPEASTWAMFLAGFGLIGLGMRRRTSVAA